MESSSSDNIIPYNSTRISKIAERILERSETEDEREDDELLFFKVMYKFLEVLAYEKTNFYTLESNIQAGCNEQDRGRVCKLA